MWIISAIISTCYTFTWDIKMDWGLFDGKYKLREELIYPRKVKTGPITDGPWWTCDYILL